MNGLSTFEEWLRVPVAHEEVDPRFELRRAAPSDFNAIYDLVDQTFGSARPRAEFDWAYRMNPGGVARCWIVAERRTGKLVAGMAKFPWPVMRGCAAVPGELTGDAVVARGCQHDGIFALLVKFAQSHPWWEGTIVLGWMNRKSRGSLRKQGEESYFARPLRRHSLVLRGGAELHRRGCPTPLARPAGAVLDGLIDAWRRLRLGCPRVHAVERVRRFDGAFDSVTDRYAAWSGIWCRHDAEFLNWRYFDHPTREYVALALVVDEKPVGYCVVRVDAAVPYVMEFVAPTVPGDLAVGLLLEARRVARAAGCSRLDFFAPLSWRHWRLFRAVGFVPVGRKLFLYVSGPGVTEADRLENWQLVPGDHDVL